MRANAVYLKKAGAIAVAVAVLPAAALAAGAAKVDFATGGVAAVGSNGAQRQLAKGAEVNSGESVVTAEGGRAQLRFSDGAMVAIQPQSEFKIDAYQHSGKAGDKEDKSFFSLLRGGLRTITGLVGRANQDAYKVKTSVATIGIRGTEYTVAYLGNGGVAVSTGEGLVEVCNAVGCALVSAGSSAIVTSSGSDIKKTEVKPRLDPAQPAVVQVATYSVSDARSSDGLTMPVSLPMVSGPGYVMAYSGAVGPNIENYVTSSGSAAFSPNSALLSHNDGTTSYSTTAVAGSFTLDGVLGWGRWTTGVKNDGYSTYDLKDFHYVVGVPTGDLTGLGGLQASYQLAGYTLPTSTTGLVGAAPSGTLVADFGTWATQVDMKVPIGGTVLSLNEIGYIDSATGTFSGGYMNYIAGFFAGRNASHAGLTYKIMSGMPAIGDVMGAAAFKQTGIAPSTYSISPPAF